jgi:hypothetical protein
MGATAATATLQYEHRIVRSAVRWIVGPVALTVLALTCGAAARQISSEPESLVVKSGALQLRALLFRPRGSGPFPAVLFNHGSYISAAPMERTRRRSSGRPSPGTATRCCSCSGRVSASRSARSDGHNLVFSSVPTWERDVFAFLDPLMQQ